MKLIAMTFRPLLALLLAASVTACGTDSSSSGGSSGNSGDSFTLRVTDAPFADVKRLDVTFREVQLRKADGSWVVVSGAELANTTIELAGLQGTKTADLFANVEVPEGDYTELRLIVDDTARMELFSTGLSVDLDIPSGSTSGLKVKGDFSVIEGLPTELVVDFDLLRSIEEIGKSGRFRMNPVLNLIEGNSFGHARGMVDGNKLIAASCSDADPDTDNAVYVFEGSGVTPNDITRRNNDVDPFTTSRIFKEGNDYKYEAAFLPAGDYTLAFTCNASKDDLKKDDDLDFFDIMDVTIKVNDTLFL